MTQARLQGNDTALGKAGDGNLIEAKALGYLGFHQLVDRIYGLTNVIVAS